MIRRKFIQSASMAAIGASAPGIFVSTGQAQQVPNSTGTELPKLKAPPGACDCHHHIYDQTRFPQPGPGGGPVVPNARVEEYQMLRARIGTTRDVIVTPLAYATDNRVTLNAIARLGPNARGVAVIRPDVTDAELKTLADGGIRGIRFSLANPRLAPTTIEMILPLSKRINDLGWHIQLNMTPDQIVAAHDLWNRVPCPMVFDHMGHVPEPAGVGHPVFTLIRHLIDKSHTWVKLSVTYDNTKDGPPGYADVTRVAQTYVRAAPERMVWGSNWPHPNEDTPKPDDAVLFDLMSQWAPDDNTRHRILVENPEKLYGFPKVA